ncbi:MAG: alpha/beta fold hydrolase [Proteobacteria bacterium]|nr:alpha/beta fold hydrolase [Pseudomonadota bacterium]
MKQLIIFLAITVSLSIGHAVLPNAARAEASPVSIIETGITEGFAQPTLYLEPEQLTPILGQNRTLQKPYLLNFKRRRGKVFARINTAFMTEMIAKQAAAFSKAADPFDNLTQPSPGYTWRLKIFHPGSSPGKLPSSDGASHIIIFCAGAGKSGPQYAAAMDWLGSYYAQKGYIVAVPDLIGNDENLSKTAFYEIATDIHLLQVQQTIDYIKLLFDNATDTNSITLIGHSLGGYTALKTAARDSRIQRLCLLSSAFVYQRYWPGFLIDSVDVFDLLNALSKQRGMALHVQRFTGPPHGLGCPEYDAECDWIPPIDGFITRVDISRDRWEPRLCAGQACGVQDGTLYNYGLYEGPKQDSIKNNNLLAHNSMYSDDAENSAGRELILQYLDAFFQQFPVE